MDSRGHLWVADQGDSMIREFSADGKLLKSFGRPGAGPGQFNDPTDVAVAPDGTIYVAESGNLRIQELTPNLKGGLMLQIYPHGPVERALLSSVATDAQGRVYATDYSESRVRVFASDGTLLRTWGGKPSGAGRLNSPDGIAVDAHNRVLYVADKYNYRVVKFTLDGQFIRTWGSKGTGPGQFGLPAGVATDRQGNVYVVDTTNNRIEEFTPSGRFIRQWGSKGTGYLQFDAPAGVAVSSTGTIYVTDYYNGRVEVIRKFANRRS
jgi:DNA-binding beta-propeller fold protein YncE